MLFRSELIEDEDVVPLSIGNRIFIATTTKQWVEGEVIIHSISLPKLSEKTSRKITMPLNLSGGRNGFTFIRFDDGALPRILASYGRQYEASLVEKVEVETSLWDAELNLINKLPKFIIPIFQKENVLISNDCWYLFVGGLGCANDRSLRYYSWQN